MKPDQAREMVKAREARRATLGERLADYKGDGAIVVPELIPTEKDKVAALRSVRKLASQLERTPRGKRRGKKLDELTVAVGRLLFVERVLELDELERAALTPAALWALSSMSPLQILERVRLLNGQKPDSGLVLP